MEGTDRYAVVVEALPDHRAVALRLLCVHSRSLRNHSWSALGHCVFIRSHYAVILWSLRGHSWSLRGYYVVASRSLSAHFVVTTWSFMVTMRLLLVTSWSPGGHSRLLRGHYVFIHGQYAVISRSLAA